MHLYIKSLQNTAEMNETLMKLFFLLMKRFAGTYFCKFGKNLQKITTIRYTES